MGNDQGEQENEEWEQNLTWQLGSVALLATLLSFSFSFSFYFPVSRAHYPFPVPRFSITSIIVTNLMSFVFLFVLFLASACQQGWTGSGTSCYKLFKSSELTWRNAQEECQKLGANLVKIESSKEEKHLIFETDHLRLNQYFWIGLSYTANDRLWKWADGTELDGYENWLGHNQPNFSYLSPCTVMHIIKWPSYYYAKWSPRSCSSRNGYICEKP